jgi:hypothetical protein
MKARPHKTTKKKEDFFKASTHTLSSFKSKREEEKMKTIDRHTQENIVYIRLVTGRGVQNCPGVQCWLSGKSDLIGKRS